MKPRQVKKFEKIVNENQKSIINFHYRFTGDKFEAENLAQETFIKAYLNYHTLKDPKKLRGWLFSIARNVVIDFFRKNKNREIALGDEMIENYLETTSADFHSQIEKDEISRELEKCVDKLSSQDRTLIRLLYFEGFSYKEICQILKINQNTLKSRLHRARTVLMETIRANDLLSDIALQYE
ncbi:MAG: RNA polymerase sigma factor [Minisyncoccia bacterium]|jgi:RNA polymerase sigma-70 factor (ECF subfamily)